MQLADGLPQANTGQWMADLVVLLGTVPVLSVVGAVAVVVVEAEIMNKNY